MGGISGLQVSTWLNMGTRHNETDGPGGAGGDDYQKLKCIRQETVDTSPSEIDASCRNSSDWEQGLPGLLSGELTFTYLFNLGDALFHFLLDAVLAPRDSTKWPQMAVMFDDAADFDSLPAGAEGFVAVFSPTSWSINRDYDSAVEVSAGYKPWDDVATPWAPQWWTKA